MYSDGILRVIYSSISKEGETIFNILVFHPPGAGLRVRAGTDRISIIRGLERGAPRPRGWGVLVPHISQEPGADAAVPCVSFVC